MSGRVSPRFSTQGFEGTLVWESAEPAGLTQINSSSSSSSSSSPSVELNTGGGVLKLGPVSHGDRTTARPRKATNVPPRSITSALCVSVVCSLPEGRPRRASFLTAALWASRGLPEASRSPSTVSGNGRVSCGRTVDLRGCGRAWATEASFKTFQKNIVQCGRQSACP